MPTYEYRCTSCGDQFEIVQSFKDTSLTACDKCQGVLRKVYGNVGISFKGTGFYKNDSKPSNGTGGSSTGSTGSSDSSTTKTDTATPSSGSTESSSSTPASTGASHGAAAASTPAAS